MDSTPAYVSCCYACLLHSSVALGSFFCNIVSIIFFFHFLHLHSELLLLCNAGHCKGGVCHPKDGKKG